VFIQEPSENPLMGLGLAVDLSKSLSDILEEEGSLDSLVGGPALPFE